jgi:uncharacterized protein involved in response to NO
MKNSYFLSQPHQPFFVLSIINSVVLMLFFALFYKGILEGEILASLFHIYSVIYLIFTPAFFGFLFTTFPRFSVTPPIEKVVYITIFVPFIIGSILFLAGSLFFKSIISFVIFFILLGHLLGINILRKIYKSSTIADKSDIFWILISMSFGGVSHLLFFIGYIFNLGSLIDFSIYTAIYLYLFMVGFGVAQRMVPFFSNVTGIKNRNILKITTVLLSIRIVLDTMIPHLSFVVDFIFVYLLGNEILNWQLPFPNRNPMLWILHLSLFWIPVAFLFSGVSNFISLFFGVNFLFLDIHILMLGFIVTIFIGFGTRVTLGHSKSQIVADMWTKVLFVWTQVVVISRIVTSIIVAFGWNFLYWFDISVTVWLVLFGLWAYRFLGLLIFGRKEV